MANELDRSSKVEELGKAFCNQDGGIITSALRMRVAKDGPGRWTDGSRMDEVRMRWIPAPIENERSLEA